MVFSFSKFLASGIMNSGAVRRRYRKYTFLPATIRLCFGYCYHYRIALGSGGFPIGSNIFPCAVNYVGDIEVGTAKFVQIWERKGSDGMVKRIVSYEHRYTYK